MIVNTRIQKLDYGIVVSHVAWWWHYRAFLQHGHGDTFIYEQHVSCVHEIQISRDIHQST